MAFAKKRPLYEVLSPEYTETCSGKITREDLDLTSIGSKGEIAYVLHGVLSPEECQVLIKKTECVGYKPALIHSGDTAILAPGFRDSYRVMIDDTKFASILFRRISHLLPQKFQSSPNSTVYRIKEINERLRFLRYDPGGQFKAHYDLPYSRPDGSAKTFVTLQLYLNQGMGGGETTFLTLRSVEVESDDDELPVDANADERISVPVAPSTGTVLVFQHDILHEGSKVREGRKYTIRMDVLYEVDDDANKKLDVEAPPKSSSWGKACRIA